ncbi:MAG: double zinc ribbon domain-containing protein [Candidatus Adiutrix sp.]|nr:double zinc ribbon domain-containing protein [Candidatus Adiutrix sp.]
MLEALADLWWPPVCAVCPRALPLAPAGSGWRGCFCPACQDTVELLPASVCPVCGRPFHHAAGHLCGDCLADPPPFLTARAAAVYKGAAALSIGRLKYHGDLTQVRALAGLAAALPETSAWDVLVPLPLSPRKLAARGFNQALVLARAAFPGRPLEPGLLSRPVEAELPQAALSRRERLKAIRGSFRAPAPGLVRGARVLLFDDVITTGATAAEAARTLLAAGARAVHLAAVAMTVRDSWR